MALIDPAKEDSVMESVKTAYLATYPHLADNYVGALCDSADGVGLI